MTSSHRKISPHPIINWNGSQPGCEGSIAVLPFSIFSWAASTNQHRLLLLDELKEFLLEARIMAEVAAHH